MKVESTKNDSLHSGFMSDTVMATGDSRRLTSAAPIHPFSPALHPDGEWLVVTRGCRPGHSHGDVHRAFLAGRGFGEGEDHEALAVGGQVQVRGATGEKLLGGPDPRLAEYERFVVYTEIHHHDAVIGSFIEQLAAILGPERIQSAAAGNLPLTCSTGREGADIDLGYPVSFER